jgi:hypothetical protein
MRRKKYDIWRPFLVTQLLLFIPCVRSTFRYAVWCGFRAVLIRRELRNCLCFNVAELFGFAGETLALGVRTVHQSVQLEVSGGSHSLSLQSEGTNLYFNL